MLHSLATDAHWGYDLANVSLLRLDLDDALAPGNKRYKLNGYVAQAAASGADTLVSFGGAWSNHLHALAAVGASHGLRTVGVVRCEPHEASSATLADARAWGMEVLPVGRQAYRKRHSADFLRQLKARFPTCLLVPEGGASVTGAAGCSAIAQQLLSLPHQARRIVLPVGTGTTLAGLVAALPDHYEVLGISALKGAVDIDDSVRELLQRLGAQNTARWKILHSHHCGGFARVSDELKQFIASFESVQGIHLDPVYTAKMLFALANGQRSGQWGSQVPTIAIHTGGLQGRRGYAWLDCAALPR